MVCRSLCALNFQRPSNTAPSRFPRNTPGILQALQDRAIVTLKWGLTLCHEMSKEKSIGVMACLNSCTESLEDRPSSRPKKRASLGLESHAKGQGRIRHYPIPLALSGPRFGIVATQYQKIDTKWVVDTNLLGNVVESQKAPENSFKVAQRRKRTRHISRKVRGYDVQNSHDGPGGCHSVIAVTGYKGAGRGRAKKRNHRETAGEDE